MGFIGSVALHRLCAKGEHLYAQENPKSGPTLLFRSAAGEVVDVMELLRASTAPPAVDEPAEASTEAEASAAAPPPAEEVKPKRGLSFGKRKKSA